MIENNVLNGIICSDINWDRNVLYFCVFLVNCLILFYFFGISVEKLLKELVGNKKLILLFLLFVEMFYLISYILME